MDPDENHDKQVRIAIKLIRALDAGEVYGIAEVEAFINDASELAELVVALNDWVGNGGFPPSIFRRNVPTEVPTDHD